MIQGVPPFFVFVLLNPSLSVNMLPFYAKKLRFCLLRAINLITLQRIKKEMVDNHTYSNLLLGIIILLAKVSGSEVCA